jgi:hypothetical protein
MIQPLRVAHRTAFVVLAVVLPAILLIGLGARTSPLGESALIADVPAPASVVMESNNLWQNHAIRSTFYDRSDRPPETDIVLQSARNLHAPDLLLYWAANPPQGNFLLTEARLVGEFKAGRTFLLPLNDKRTGYLVLFSSAHQSVFDTARVERLP